jgi:xanthine/CO dehydrogenase XdhC/CoxF family maturation factor
MLGILMSIRRIIRTFEAWRERAEPMVLATVYETLGSTYSKAGHRILIADNGDYQGLVSGGCLEGDLAARSREVIAKQQPAAVTYDMRDEADELWGLGVGCNGLIRVFLQPLDPRAGYAPFGDIVAQLLGTRTTSIALVIASGREELPPGGTLIWDRNPVAAWQLEGAAIDRLADGCKAVQSDGVGARYERTAEGLEILYSPLHPIPRLLVLGAGLDAIPLVNFAAELGWLVTVADHRPAYLEHGDFSAADAAQLIVPSQLAETFDLGQFDAVVVMSHHLATDRTYLAQLATVQSPYLGVLGPAARKERLLDALGADGEALRGRLNGPVGLDIGADSPESIALSVLAEIHAALKRGSAMVAARRAS